MNTNSDTSLGKLLAGVVVIILGSATIAIMWGLLVFAGTYSYYGAKCMFFSCDTFEEAQKDLNAPLLYE